MYQIFGYVSRMDNLQAAILNFKLSKLKNVISKRRENYKIYKKYLSSNVFFPEEKQVNLTPIIHL